MIEYFYKHGAQYLVDSSKNYSEFRQKVKSTGDFLCFLVQNPTEKEIQDLRKDFHLEEKPFRKFRNETRALRYNFNPLIFTFTDYYTAKEKIKI